MTNIIALFNGGHGCAGNCSQGRHCTCWRDTDIGFVHDLEPFVVVDEVEEPMPWWQVLLMDWGPPLVGVSVLCGLGIAGLRWAA